LETAHDGTRNEICVGAGEPNWDITTKMDKIVVYKKIQVTAKLQGISPRTGDYGFREERRKALVVSNWESAIGGYIIPI